MVQYLGWAATAVFVGSYFCRRADVLRAVQMAGALMWVAYGLLIGASPVVVANLLVVGAAAWTAARPSLDAGRREPSS
ncbi:MAG: lactate dehydrogenase [Acidobacteriota bacterium]